MREILFKAKRIDNEKWISGLLCYNIYGQLCIQPAESDNCCVIIPETVGQYTGLTDKNGERIFEGDVVVTNKFGTPEKKYKITYNETIATYIGKGKKGCVGYFTTFSDDADAFEVIGNIHDNPELIGGGENA